jgi:DNA-binding LytR/AlgR family response regulator
MSSKKFRGITTILDPNYFFRIHHSYNINLRHNQKTATLELTNGIILPVAKRRQEGFNKFIKLRLKHIESN